MNRTWDEKVVLISSNGYEEDEIGQQVPIEVEQEIWCCKEKYPEMNSILLDRITWKFQKF